MHLAFAAISPGDLWKLNNPQGQFKSFLCYDYMNAIIQRRKCTRHVLIQLTQTDTYTETGRMGEAELGLFPPKAAPTEAPKPWKGSVTPSETQTRWTVAPRTLTSVCV